MKRLSCVLGIMVNGSFFWDFWSKDPPRKAKKRCRDKRIGGVGNKASFKPRRLDIVSSTKKVGV